MDFETFRKYMQGSCTPAERIRFEQWWTEHPREVDAWFEQVWNEQPEPHDAERAEMWEQVKPQVRRGGGYFRWAAVAALVVAFSGYLLTRHRHEPAPVERWATLANDSPAPRHFVLPDSTGVWLNGHSSLAYNNLDRRTRLTGEAFFNVRKDPARPFKRGSPGDCYPGVGDLL